jgi:TolB protein
MDADGSDQVNLTNNPASDHEPAWPLDGTKIAFTSIWGGNSVREIYVMKPRPEGEKNRPQNLYKHSSAIDGEANWSPDGKRITFTRGRGVGEDFEIYSMAADGIDQAPLTENQETE